MNRLLKNKHFHLAVLLLAVACMFFLLNLLTPMTRDDYTYAFSWKDKARIESFSQIPESLKAHYQVQNGRILPHAALQTFLMLDKNVFNLVNTVLFVLYGILIFLHIVKGGGILKTMSYFLV